MDNPSSGGVPARPLKFSIFHSDRDPINKQVNPAAGTSHSGTLSTGNVMAATVPTLLDFHQTRSTLNALNALGYGINTKADVGEWQPVTTKGKAAMPEPGKPVAITRTRNNFVWPADADMILMLDIDTTTDIGVQPHDALNALLSAVSFLRSVELLWVPSSSSMIVGPHGDTGLRGQRVYVRLAAGADAHAAGKFIADTLWSNGYGVVIPSKAGTPLYRTLIDTSVWTAEHLDYAAAPGVPADCQWNPNKVFHYQQGGVLAAPDPMAAEIIAADAAKKRNEALLEAKDRLRSARAAYIEARVNEAPADQREKVRRQFTIATEGKKLPSDFVLHMDDGTTPTVGDVLARRGDYHGATLADPLEPDYGGGRNKARLKLDGSLPVCHSLAHGGQTFTLLVQTERFELGGGRGRMIAEQLVELLADTPGIFRTSAGLVQVGYCDIQQGLTVSQMDLQDVLVACETVASFYRVKHSKERGDYEVEDDLQLPIAQRVVSIGSRHTSPIRPLDGILTAPTVLPDGRIIQDPGYDPTTRLFYDPQCDFERVQPGPVTPEQVKWAMETFLSPITGYQFKADVDRSVAFCALLTAVVRKTLPTAPGFAFTAPQAGSGKTMLAQIAGIYATGSMPQIRALPIGESELRKSMLGALMSLPSVMLFDNIESTMKSSSLCAILTSPRYSDRVLGENSTFEGSTAALFLFTGNNVKVAGDMNRRMMSCRIAPQTVGGVPGSGSFDFNPVDVARRKWCHIRVAGLVLIKAYFDAGCPQQIAPAFGSYDEWSRLVRHVAMYHGYCDPVSRVSDNYVDDEETVKLEEVMALWDGLYSDRQVTNEDWRRTLMLEGSAHREALRAIIDDKLNANSFAKYLARYEGRELNGRRFLSGRMADGNRTRFWELSRTPQA